MTWDLGLREEALAADRRSLPLVERLASAAPTDPDVWASLGRCHARLGFAYRTMGRPTKALRSYEQAREIQELLARKDDANAHRREVLSWTLSNLGVIQQELGHTAEAIRLHRRAIANHEELVRRLPATTRHRSDPVLYGVDHARNQLYLASQHVFSGRLAKADACFRRVEEVAMRSVHAPLGVLLYDMACASSLWSVAVQDGSIEPAEREERSRRSIAALRRACEDGRRDLDQIRQDPVLDPLRSRRDYQELVMDLAFPTDAFQHREK